MTALNQSVGLKIESAYGSYVVPDRGYETTSESLRYDIGRTRGASLRAGQRHDRSDRMLPFITGVSGGITMDVPTKGFGRVSDGIMGSSSVGSAVDSNYTQTHVAGSLVGKSYSVQVNRPDTSATDRAFTYLGCKFAGATFSCDVDGVLMAELDIIGQDMATGTALASASYQTCHVFSFTGGSLTCDGTAVPVRDYKVSIRNNFATRRFVRGSALTLEPLEDGKREIEVSFTAEFSDLTLYNRYKSATTAGAVSSVVATFSAPLALAGSTVPTIVFTPPTLALGNGVDGPNVSGNEIPTVAFTGKALYDGSNEPLCIAYKTPDSAI